ncbi:MAG TPA: response regulator transcription factor [Candidatus Krumholzibacteria bacterium]|nr:response regulator transcription factor [Candidatus Krumholzibacteria bacterium]
MRILLVEDDRQLRLSIARGLREASYAVDQAGTGTQALSLASANQYDAVILDVLLPDKTGVAVCSEVRRGGNAVPILILTALDGVDQRIAGLDAGADDYLTKPFGVDELLARIRVALRHAHATQPHDEAALTFGSLHIDFVRREVRIDERVIHLTPTEYKMLSLLARNAGRVLTHRQIIREVWGPSYAGQNHHVRVHMAELRKKIEADPARPRLIITEPGVGYRLRD